MSSAAMASSSVSQEDMENDFERTSRRSRIRMARGRDVRGQHLTTAATRLAADPVAEAEDAGEPRPLDISGYSGDHDASPKPAARAKDKRPVRPSHPNKGKQQRDRDRRKLREKRRSSGVVHMPSTEMSSTGGSTSEDEEVPSGPAAAAGAEARRPPLPDAETAETAGGPVPTVPRPDRHFKSPRRNKSLSDLDADDEDNNQDCDSLGPPDTPAAGAVPPPSPPLEPAAARLLQLEEENNRLRQLLAERDRRIAGLEETAERGALEHHQLRLRNDALTKALSALTAK
ncbi:PRKC apoptosis WT1 regulator protein-like [Amphibalanus amphitrite]|nr:PRKC apoptosis WT1 regulator protein-like [Amphibalanus amphitrite]XP_043195846.1 PRKC apoptosis WT1 regulator protein-like [Amphibalanus amphitrite]XP_043195847.1 PRKC apoptosis WT1 regulator protein-like [Amphibalanus amphitrite]XP_043195848.1 PRKC apoptosis WT1 regulator protein-like [Amphibalanus amphitrite]XP_043195849.1 PRKC apoptosis WT1 regulator protein-like [Amphibalanus amphitrite]